MKAEKWTRGRGALASMTLFALGATSCASSSSAPPRSAADPAAARREWSSRVRTQISGYWNPWDVVQSAGSPAASPGPITTVLRMAVQSDGTAPQPQILTSSRVPALDDAAVRAVVAALPLPAPPPGLMGGASSIPFDLGFRVVRGADSKAPPEDDGRAVISANCEPKPPGKVDPYAIQHTVETRHRDVEVCVEAEHNAGQDPVGDVTVEFVIAESGNVDHPIVLKGRGLTRSLEGCVLRVMAQWIFPQPAGGVVKVAFPFRFGGGQVVGAEVQSHR